MSTINPGEVYHNVARRRGSTAAQRPVYTVFEHPNLRLAQATWERIQAASGIKPSGGFSYADAFAVALSQELSGPLVTGDPEFAWNDRGC